MFALNFRNSLSQVQFEHHLTHFYLNSWAPNDTYKSILFHKFKLSYEKGKAWNSNNINLDFFFF